MYSVCSMRVVRVACLMCSSSASLIVLQRSVALRSSTSNTAINSTSA